MNYCKRDTGTDFNCPKCNGAIEMNYDNNIFDGKDYIDDCPYCDFEFEVEVEISYAYTVKNATK